jgi:hypothetical protein
VSQVVPYEEFLSAKAQLATTEGFLDVTIEDVHPILKPHQADAVVWAVRGGRRALFEAFGLGKTMQQLEICRLVLEKTGGGRGLIVCPLGVRQEFVRDGRLLGIEPTFIRSIDEASTDGIYLTNYETVRDGKLDPRDFTVISLDEAAVLRGFGGSKTFRELEDAAGTVTARDKQALLVPYFRTGVARSVTEPAGTVTSHDREALVLTDADIDDCLFRMLKWPELLRAQSMSTLPDGTAYRLTARRRDHRGKMRELSDELRVKMVGNAVSSYVAAMIGGAVAQVLLG